MHSKSIVLALSIFGLACGAPPSDERDIVLYLDAGPGLTADEVTLSGLSATRRSSVIGVEPQEGNVFVRVELTVANGLSEAISVAPIFFRIRTTDSLETPASPLSGQLDGGCPETSFLSPDGQLTCSLLFEISGSATATHLVYSVTTSGATVPMRIERGIPPISP